MIYKDASEMTWVVTGTHGTVAPALMDQIKGSCIPWLRNEVSPEDPDAIRIFLDKHKPDGVIHCAMGSPDWAAWMAEWCLSRFKKFYYISSVSVFSGKQPGLIEVGDVPDAEDDYGMYKAHCERAVREVNRDAYIIRLGWQIGTKPGSNNMVDYLANEYEREGILRLNSFWVPSCSLLVDTAMALGEIMEKGRPGVYHLEGNGEGLSMPSIAMALNHRYGFGWHIEQVQEAPFENRMSMRGNPIAVNPGNVSSLQVD